MMRKHSHAFDATRRLPFDRVMRVCAATDNGAIRIGMLYIYLST